MSKPGKFEISGTLQIEISAEVTAESEEEAKELFVAEIRPEEYSNETVGVEADHGQIDYSSLSVNLTQEEFDIESLYVMEIE